MVLNLDVAILVDLGWVDTVVHRSWVSAVVTVTHCCGRQLDNLGSARRQALNDHGLVGLSHLLMIVQ